MEQAEKGRVCPLCCRTYTEPPALSRKDNETEICPDCGMLEALASVPGGYPVKIVRNIRNNNYRRYIMSKTKEDSKTAQAVSTTQAQEPEINEADGEPIFHADEEEGGGDE